MPPFDEAAFKQSCAQDLRQRLAQIQAQGIQVTMRDIVLAARLLEPLAEQYVRTNVPMSQGDLQELRLRQRLMNEVLDTLEHEASS